MAVLMMVLAVWSGACARDRGGAERGDVGAVRVIVVRHAEKMDDDGGDDPGLTDAGRAWAAGLARFCAGQGVTAVVATPFRRTMETAWPTAEALGLPVLAVPVSSEMGMHVESIVRLIEGDAGGGCWLVVGHSNTVPAIVGRLGGVDPAGLVIEESSYGDLFVLTRTGGAVIAGVGGAEGSREGVGGGWSVRRGRLEGGQELDSPARGDGI